MVGYSRHARAKHQAVPTPSYYSVLILIPEVLRNQDGTRPNWDIATILGHGFPLRAISIAPPMVLG